MDKNTIKKLKESAKKIGLTNELLAIIQEAEGRLKFKVGKKYIAIGENMAGPFEVIVKVKKIEKGMVKFEEIKTLKGLEGVEDEWEDYLVRPMYKYKEIE